MIKNLFLIIFISILLINKIYAKNDIFIYATIDQDIITNFDIKKETEYLKILNPDLSKLSEEKIFQISKNSLIKEIIKKNEIKKFFDLEKENPFVKDYLRDLYLSLNFKDESEFIKFLESYSNYSINEIKRKLKIEIMWNELIYSRYYNQLRIDKDEFIKKIDNLTDKPVNEYLLSEIVFKKEKDQDLENQINTISQSIKDVGFENAANIYSLSESSKLGGKIGWVSENNLSQKILKKIINLKKDEITEVIQLGNNYLILKINEIRKKNISINKDEELEKMIKFETNKQLNQFSKIYFNKSKINYSINENKPILIIAGEPKSIFLKFLNL